MKILLVGEYSRLHNSLKEALEKLGHTVTLISTGDSFKNYSSDIDVSSRMKKNSAGFFMGKVIHRLSGIDIFEKERKRRLYKVLPKLRDYDVVQFINQDPFGLDSTTASLANNMIIKQNKKSFLLACGEDSHVIEYYSRNLMRYSTLTPLIENPKLESEYHFSLRYLQKGYKKNYTELAEKVQGIIPTDFDYKIPYENHRKAMDMIPNPINIDKIAFHPLEIDGKIRIFHGINRSSFYKKGSPLILNVLRKIENKYPDKVVVHTTENLPYNQYIQIYQQAHILIDQLYSYDQGYNALEAMAAGKCVLSGAEKEWKAFYQPNEEVLINAFPDEKKLFMQIEELINDPEKIMHIGKNARDFIEREHHYISIAQKYLDTWQKKA